MAISKFTFLFVILFLTISFISCSNGVNEKDEENKEDSFEIESVSGVIQKGPFNSGGNISLYELNSDDLSQTGRSFNAQIKNNFGEFEFSNIELSSPFAHLRADGFYYNEIRGEQSGSQLTLHAISDFSGDSVVNVNVLTHLEKPRIEYLVSEAMEFEEAKKQAESEVLSIFLIDQSASPSQKMDLTDVDNGNETLLAVSAILQGYRSEAELSELLSNLTDDLREDGTIDNSSLGSELINHSRYLLPDIIRNNLQERYTDLGLEVEIPEFGHVIEYFNEHTPFEITKSLISYPPEGRFGVNILFPDSSHFTTKPSTSFFQSLSADLAEGTALRIRISTLEGSPTSTEGMWVYDVFSHINMEVGSYDYANHTQEFVALESGESIDLKIRFDPGRFLVEYFEMDTEAEEPVWSREFTVSY
ncbi:MAG: hypothetical protein WD059_02835 [Balneolaceae bacterium]